MGEEQKKIYTIVINGVKESADAVEELRKKLEQLSQTIDEIQNKTLKVDINGSVATPSATQSPSSNAGRVSELSEEERITKEIEKTRSKIAETERDEYQLLLQEKEALKESQTASKSRFAEDNLAVKEYANTLQGVKERLADVKQAMQTKEIGSEQFNNLTKEANDLNNKLKEVEESYGQFGRNVGNYKSAADGFKSFKVEVNGTTREFDSANQAAKELSRELKTMSANGQQGTQEFKELHKTVLGLNSAIKDATVSSKGMDAMLDTLQSFASIGSITEGFSALFGFDDSEIERSIQKLVALQDVMKGVEEIKQQMATGEGIGGWLAAGNEAIDNFVNKITGAKEAQEAFTESVEAAKDASEAAKAVTEGLSAASDAGKASSEGLAAAQTAQATATKGATLATKGLSLALKGLGIGLVIAAVMALITYWDDLKETVIETIPALKNFGSWLNKLIAIAVGVGNVILNWLVRPIETVAKVIFALINGEFSKIPGIIAEGLKKQFNVIGNFQKGFNKETERQQKAHNQKMLNEQKEANKEWLKDEEAKYGKSTKTTKEYVEKQQKLIDQQLANEKKGSEKYKALMKEKQELQRKQWEAERKEREDNDKKKAAADKKAAKEDEEEKKKLAEAEKDLYALKIANMKEGLNKILTQLEEEKRQKLEKIISDGVLVAERTAELEKYYRNREIEEREKWAKQVEQVNKNMWDSIYKYAMETHKKEAKNLEDSLNLQRLNFERKYTEKYNQSVESYGIQGKEQLSPSTADKLNIVSTQKNKITEDIKTLVDLERQVQTTCNEIKTLEAQIDYTPEDEEKLQTSIDLLENTLSERESILEEYTKKVYKLYNESDINNKKQELLSESYSSGLTETFQQRYSVIEMYWEQRKVFEKEAAEAIYQEQITLEKENLEKLRREAADTANDLVDTVKKGIKEGTITEKDGQEAIDRIISEHADRMASEAEAHNNKLLQIEEDKNNKLKKLEEDSYADRLQQMRDFQSAISNLESKQPVINAWGITNLKATNANDKNLSSSYEEQAKKIDDLRKKLQVSFDKGLIGRESFESSNRELDRFVADVGEKMDKVKERLSFRGQAQELAKGINEWIQAVGSTMNDILGSLSEIVSNGYEKLIEEQDKYIDELQERYDKQKDITQEYADAVTSIEDELSTARGDRRQQLIDMLNSQMAAQRESLAEEKRIEKEQEKAEQKKKKLEHDQAVAKKKMQMAQAIINMHMAISMAAVNSWPIPAIPMMALATAAGAAQIAAIQSQNIPEYGEGGLLKGKSHKEGGIKVLGGAAEVEGGEYVINKTTTAKNIDLIEYVNSKKKRVDLSDMVEFYGGKASVRKNITAMRTKFADGGQLPTLRNDIEIDNRLLNAMEDYSNRPVQVAVVDIIDRTQAVNNVKVMAGLNV